MDIFNVEENIKDHMNEANEADLHRIGEEFKRGIFLNVLSKTKTFRSKHEISTGLAKVLFIIDAICYTQTGENKKAADIIDDMFQKTDKNMIDDIILYGNLAFMCDYKLARKIMSNVVKQIENMNNHETVQLAHVYLILGEAEENLENIVRAIRYYKRGLSYLQKNKEKDEQTILFLHFKLGALHSMNNQTDDAIDYLQKTIELTDETNIEIKMNSLVSIAKMYGSKQEYEKAFPYLKEAVPILEGSTLDGKLVHAEAYTEMAYNYFDQSQYDEAVPYYEKAIVIHEKLPNKSKRELGMIYMQYAYCMENKEHPEKLLSGTYYEKAIEQLEKETEWELLESALAEVISFYERVGNKRKKRNYENKFVQLKNKNAST